MLDILFVILVCSSRHIKKPLKLLVLMADQALTIYLEYQKWNYYLSIPNVSKVLIGFKEEERDKLIKTLNAQKKYGYYFIGFKEINAQSIRYISNSVYYFHINQNNSIDTPIFLYKKFFAVPLSYQNYLSSSNQFYVYLIGKINSSLTKNSISDLPHGSAILVMGHQEPERTLPIIYNELHLSFFYNDHENIYINFVRTIILSPFSKTLIIKTNNNVVVFELSFCPVLTENFLYTLKVKQIESFRDFFHSEIQNSLYKIKVVQEFTEFIEQNLLDLKAIKNFINHFDNIKQYETVMLFNYIVSNAPTSIDQLMKVNVTPINSMTIRNHSALHIAATHANRDIVKLLISHGADPGYTDNHNHTPFITAIKNHNHDIIEYFHKELNYCISKKDIEELHKTTFMNLSDFLCTSTLPREIEEYNMTNTL